MDSTEKLFQSLRSKKSEEEKLHDVLCYLEEGANVNATDPKKKNNTPLHIAVQNSDLKIVELLLSKKANVTVKNDLNQNPLELAKSLPEVDDDILSLLNEHFSQLNVSSKVETKIDTNTHTEKQSLSHDKRDGTASGLTGQFYESKILSLILFRCLTDDTIVWFYLGTNLKDVGDLDDVCLKYQLKGESKPRMLFVQAKHRETLSKDNDITLDDLKTSKDFKLVKYYNSYKNIRAKFHSSDKDIMFKCKYEDVECDFVIFTPSGNKINNEKYKSNSISGGHYFEKLFCSRNNLTNIFEIPKFNNINETFQISDKEENLVLLQEQIILQDIETLSEILKTHILNGNEENYKNIMTKDLIKIYHVILAQKVFQVGDIITQSEGTSENTLKVSVKNPAEKYRKGTFHAEFFSTDNVMIKHLRQKLFDGMSAAEQTRYKPDSAVPFTFRLPAAFGSIDLMLNESKKTKRIDYLARTIVMLAKNSKDGVININLDSFNESNKSNQINMGFIHYDGGIASLVGNLLVFNNETKRFYFNDSEDDLKENSKLLFYKLKKLSTEAFGDENTIYQYEFNIDIYDFPKLYFDCDKVDKLLVKDYLSKLWFFTKQCQHHELQAIIQMEIECQFKQEYKNRLLRIQSDAIFLKFHEKVQEWWMTKLKSDYLTKSCTYYELAKQEIIDSPILTVLNLTNIHIRKKQTIRFKNDAFHVLGLKSFFNSTTNILNISSAESFLTMIKLAQYFENYENTAFLDFGYILENGYYEMMISELTTTKLEIFIILTINQESTQQLCQTVAEIFRGNLKKKVIIVTQTNISDTIKSQLNAECLFHSDGNCDLRDITNDNTACENWTLIFQGQTMAFKRVIEEKSKRLVNSHILAKLIKNETIEIGRPLTNKRFDEVQQYCIHRNLTRGEEHSIKTFKDINENVVIISAEPGMGKSVLMNQLACQTKEFEQSNSEPSSWIAYINLRDYSLEFKSWKLNNLRITKIEALRFICKTVIEKLDTVCGKPKIIKNQNNNPHAFKITIEGEDIQVKPFTKDNELAFELQLFIDFYNKGNVILVFDGFDEICPQYEKQATSLIKELTRNYHTPQCGLLNPLSMMQTASMVQNAMSILQQGSLTRCECPLMGAKQQRIWVTTRSYSNIKNALESELGRSAFTLKPLSKEEQNEYLMGYFEINFCIPNLTEHDIIELNEFLDYMLTALSDESRHLAMVSVPLYTVYTTAVKYFQRKFLDNSFDNIEMYIKDLKDKCADAYSVLARYGIVFELQKNIRDLTTISENPLHLYMASEYFYSQIKERTQKQGTTSHEKWDINIKSFSLFENFLETKFTKIRFEEKINMDTSISDADTTLKSVKQDFMDKHKKMALCAIFDRKDLKQLLPENFFDSIDDIMIQINTGEEKTGVIITVIDKIPRFVHLVFAEYFAIEYISDLLKSASKSEIELPTLENLWSFVMNIVLYNSTGGVRTFFNHKLRNDPELMTLISSDQNKRIAFESMLKQGKENEIIPDGFNSLLKLLRTSLNVAIEENLTDVQSYIFECIKSSLNDENVDEFTEIMSNSFLVLSAIGTNNDKFIENLKEFLQTMPNSDDIFFNLAIPKFAQRLIPFKLNPSNASAGWNLITRMVPQLADLNPETAVMTPTLRYAVFDYIKVFWDIMSNMNDL